MTREKLLNLRELEVALTLAEERKREFDNCFEFGGDPRLAIRKLFESMSYHPSDQNLKAIGEILSNDLDQKRAEAKVAFETA